MGPGPLQNRPRRGHGQLIVTDYPSPNHGPRPEGAVPRVVVLHYTGMASAQAALDRMCDPEAEVSAHYQINATGEVLRLVPETHRAWHAGRGHWANLGDVNDHSIGIELDNAGTHPFAAAQMAALETLLADILGRQGIAPARVIGHSDMAPDRKCDPGPRFDWRRLARRGLAVWPAPDTADGPAPDAERFRQDAARFGYDPDLEDDLLLWALRLRFRPAAEGPLAAEDMAVAAALAAIDPDAASA